MLSVLCLGFQLPAAPLPTVPMRAITPTMNMLEKAKPQEKQSIGDKLWSINTANKMQMVKVGQKAKVRGRKLPKAVLEITQTRFKKKYPMKDMEVLWGALLACYGTEHGRVVSLAWVAIALTTRPQPLGQGLDQHLTLGQALVAPWWASALGQGTTKPWWRDGAKEYG